MEFTDKQFEKYAMIFATLAFKSSINDLQIVFGSFRK